MAHIHTKPGQHDHTVSAFIVRLDGKEPRVLLHKHKLLNVYMQVGGHIELHENPWQAIVHEVREESGYELKQLQLLQPQERIEKLTNSILHPIPVYVNTHEMASLKDHFHIDSAYVFTASTEPAHKPYDSESVELGLFTRAELRQLEESEIFDNVRETCDFIFDVCLKNWETIPASEI